MNRATTVDKISETNDRGLLVIGGPARCKELAGALAAVQGQLGGVAKTSKGYNYQYADLATVWDSIRKPLSENGLAVVQTTDNDDNGNPIIITTLIHTSGEWISGRLVVKPVKPDPQALGSAITYGRRYALMAIVGVAPADDDGAEASKPTPKRELLQGMKQQSMKQQPEAREPSTKLREHFKALYTECLRAGVDPRKLSKINPDSTDDEVRTAGEANRLLLDKAQATS